MTHSARPTLPVLIDQRRWWLLPLVLWAAVVALSLQSQTADIRRQSIQVATEGARNMFRMVVLTRNWNASHGGVYVPVTPKTQPNPYLQHPRRDARIEANQSRDLVHGRVRVGEQFFEAWQYPGRRRQILHFAHDFFGRDRLDQRCG